MTESCNPAMYNELRKKGFPRQQDLFGVYPFKLEKEQNSWKDVFHGILQKNVSVEGVFELPRLKPIIAPKCLRLVPFHVALKMRKLRGYWIH